jgi:hypothetical protein
MKMARSNKLFRKAAASDQLRRTVASTTQARREARTPREVCFSEPKIKIPKV